MYKSIIFLLCFCTITEIQKIVGQNSQVELSNKVPVNNAGKHQFEGTNVSVKVPVDFKKEIALKYLYNDTWQFWLNETKQSASLLDLFIFDDKAIIENQERIGDNISYILLDGWQEFNIEEPNEEEKFKFIDHVKFKCLNYDGVLLNYKSTHHDLSYFYIKLENTFVVAKFDRSNKEDNLKIFDFINTLTLK